MVIPHKVKGKLLGELVKVLLRDYPMNVLMPRHIARWLCLKVEAFMGVDPDRIHCFYKGKKPDLAHTRNVVLGRRIQALVSLLGDCVVGGVLAIPEETSRSFREEYPRVRFLGSTLAGLNQVVTGELALAGERGEFEGKVGTEEEVITESMLYSFAQCEGKKEMWATRYAGLKTTGTSKNHAA